MNSFFTEEQLNQYAPYGNYQITSLISADSYDEEAILKSINDLGLEAAKLLQQCALQIAIIGAGNKSFGAIRLDNEDVIPLINIFRKYNIRYENIINSKLDKGELTPRRLMRFYRHCTKAFIQRNNRPSYLWLKYSDHNQEFRDICFPGAEHLVTTKQEYNYLCEVYKCVDQRLGTSFHIRLQRVGIARGLYDPSIL